MTPPSDFVCAKCVQKIRFCFCQRDIKSTPACVDRDTYLLSSWCVKACIGRNTARGRNWENWHKLRVPFPRKYRDSHNTQYIALGIVRLNKFKSNLLPDIFVKTIRANSNVQSQCVFTTVETCSGNSIFSTLTRIIIWNYISLVVKVRESVLLRALHAHRDSNIYQLDHTTSTPEPSMAAKNFSGPQQEKANSIWSVPSTRHAISCQRPPDWKANNWSFIFNIDQWKVISTDASVHWFVACYICCWKRNHATCRTHQEKISSIIQPSIFVVHLSFYSSAIKHCSTFWTGKAQFIPNQYLQYQHSSTAHFHGTEFVTSPIQLVNTTDPSSWYSTAIIITSLVLIAGTVATALGCWWIVLCDIITIPVICTQYFTLLVIHRRNNEWKLFLDGLFACQQSVC